MNQLHGKIFKSHDLWYIYLLFNFSKYGNDYPLRYKRFNNRRRCLVKGKQQMDVKLILVALTGLFTLSCLFFGTKNGFYDSDNYHGNGSAH